jgi:hypothetical protein
MDKEDLRRRTKQFALRVIRLVGALPRTRAAQVIGNQLLRSATSVATNYRAACRGRSHELTAIFVASRKTAKKRKCLTIFDCNSVVSLLSVVGLSVSTYAILLPLDRQIQRLGGGI